LTLRQFGELAVFVRFAQLQQSIEIIDPQAVILPQCFYRVVPQ